jgi:LysM repeat protein
VELPRRELARFAAPAAFLLALTIAALLVHAGLSGGGESDRATTSTRLVTERVTTAKAQTTTKKKQGSAKRFYTIQSGDTLDIVAARVGTTTERLLALNPGIDPHALTVGQRVRIG